MTVDDFLKLPLGTKVRRLGVTYRIIGRDGDQRTLNAHLQQPAHTEHVGPHRAGWLSQLVLWER